MEQSQLVSCTTGLPFASLDSWNMLLRLVFAKVVVAEPWKVIFSGPWYLLHATEPRAQRQGGLVREG